MKLYNSVFVASLLIFFIFQGFYSNAKDSTYATNQLLIKLKNDTSLENIFKKTNIKYKRIKRLHTIIPVVNKAKKNLSLAKNKDGNYLFLHMEYRDISGIPDEEVFKIAYKEMNETEKSTYRNYLIIFPRNTDIEKIIIRLRNDQNIESVEKNLIVKIRKNK